MADERREPGRSDPSPADTSSAGLDGGDYRTVLAAERTYLAYVRTAVVLISVGAAVVTVLPGASQQGLRQVAGVVLVLLGLYLAVHARRRWRAIERAVNAGVDIPADRSDSFTVAALVVAGLLALVMIVTM